MTRDALDGSRLISVALLRPGYETMYHTLNAPIHEIVCVGRIFKEERLADGRYNFLLRGHSRAKIVEEDKDLPYRRAKLEPLIPKALPCEVEVELRRSIVELLGDKSAAGLAAQINWLNLVERPGASFSDLVDILAASILNCPQERQRFLEQVCAAKRAQCLCALLQSLQYDVEKLEPGTIRPRTWPPGTSNN